MSALRVSQTSSQFDFIPSYCPPPLPPMNESLTLSSWFWSVLFLHFTFLCIAYGTSQSNKKKGLTALNFCKLGLHSIFSQENLMLKIWLNPSWDKLNHLLRNQMPRGLFCLMDTTRRTTHIINEIQGKGHPEVKHG